MKLIEIMGLRMLNVYQKEQQADSKEAQTPKEILSTDSHHYSLNRAQALSNDYLADWSRVFRL